jgi:hypothetical protein
MSGRMPTAGWDRRPLPPAASPSSLETARPASILRRRLSPIRSSKSSSHTKGTWGLGVGLIWRGPLLGPRPPQESEMPTLPRSPAPTGIASSSKPAGYAPPSCFRWHPPRRDRPRARRLPPSRQQLACRLESRWARCAAQPRTVRPDTAAVRRPAQHDRDGAAAGGRGQRVCRPAVDLGAHRAGDRAADRVAPPPRPSLGDPASSTRLECAASPPPRGRT